MPHQRPTGRGRFPDRGASPIEAAIVFPLILMIIFGVVQVVTYFLARAQAQTAAQAAVSTQRQLDAQPGDGKDHAEAFLQQAGDWLTGVQVSDPAYTADTVTYTVSGVALSIVPGVTWPVEQSAHGTLERFTP